MNKANRTATRDIRIASRKSELMEILNALNPLIENYLAKIDWCIRNNNRFMRLSTGRSPWK